MIPILAAVALLLFTGPTGTPIYIAKDQVVAVTPAIACATGAKAIIHTSQLPICVRETVEESVKKIEGQ